VTVRGGAACPLCTAGEDCRGDVDGLADRLVRSLVRREWNEEAVADTKRRRVDLLPLRRPQQRSDQQEDRDDEGRDSMLPDPADDVVDALAEALSCVARPLVAELACAWVSRADQPRSR